MATTPNYDIDYNDKRLTDVKTTEQEALTNNSQTYDEMIGGVDERYQGIADTIQTNADKMAQVQQENTDFQIQQIEQQKQQAQKDYTKEQSGSYVDWQKQSNQYGANAEQMASQGMQGSGYSESSQVSMFNTYQNRVAVAREGLQKLIMNYDNNIQQAIIQNNSALAQIHSEASLKQAEILLEGFQYKNTLVQEKTNKELQLKQFYSNEYQNVLNQMNTENAMAENVRQFNEQQALEREQMQKSYELQLAELTEKKRQFDEEMARMKKLDDEEAKRKAEELRIASQQAQAQISKIKSEAKAYTIEDDVISGGGDIVTNSAYWNGARAENVGGYGYFSNGYQPKGIKIGNKTYELKSSGVQITFPTTDLWGNKKTVTQTVWMANGKYYYWEGRENKYKTAKYDSETGTFKTT